MESPVPHLSAAFRHSIGILTLDVRFQLTQPWTILFGPSGSGKTTILRAIAGLVTPQSGSIRLRGVGEKLFDTESNVNLPPHARFTPLAPQSSSLFPHLTVRDHLTYGGNVDAGHATAFGIEELLDRLPAQLSGGEAQRVNLARAALTRNPRLLLLDEPFTGMEVPQRDELIDRLLSWQRESAVPILSVTHDVVEALRLQADVIKLHAGHIVAQGPAHHVLDEERAGLLAQLQRN